MHAPNHRNLKGTDHIFKAVEELQEEGLALELVVIEGLPNPEVLRAIRSADVVVDQLVIGWYAMFALEAMVLGKPVVCHIRDDLLNLYIATGLLRPDEMPLIDSTVHVIKETLRELAALPRGELWKIGDRSRAFVEEHHSSLAVGRTFDRINRSIGIEPTQPNPARAG